MEREGRIPPGLVAGLIVFVLVIGALAYSAGRFGRRPRSDSPAEALPPPAAPAPAAQETVPTPADIPPTVTPAAPVVVEKTSRTTRVVEKSTQITVPIAPAAAAPQVQVVPTPTPGGRRVVVEVINTPRPLPSPTVPELEQAPEEMPEELPEEPEPEPTPGPRAQAGGSPVSI
jgi:hypothetical protein